MRDVFAHSGLLFALLALPIVTLLTYFASRGRERRLVQMSGLVGSVLLSRQRPSRLGRFFLALGLMCLVLGMAGPRWGRDWSQSAAPGRDLVIVLDLSRSMYAEAPSRLDRACRTLEDLSQTLRTRGGHRLALIVFAGTSRLMCPLTHDLDHFRECVEAIDRDVPDSTLGNGTRIGAAIALAVESFSGRSPHARDILLLSDGDDPARDGEWRQGIDGAIAARIPVHVLGIGESGEGHRIPLGSGWLIHGGTEIRTRLEIAPLRMITGDTGGQLFLVGMKPFALGEQYLTHLATATREEDSPDRLPVLKQRQVWFFLPALGFLSLSLILPPRGQRR